jgi:hypothetical protein
MTSNLQLTKQNDQLKQQLQEAEGLIAKYCTESPIYIMGTKEFLEQIKPVGEK